MICCLSGNFYVSMLCGLFMEYLVAECWFGPYMSALQSSLPPRVRGLGISVMMFSATFFGSLMSFAIGEWYGELVVPTSVLLHILCTNHRYYPL